MPGSKIIPIYYMYNNFDFDYPELEILLNNDDLIISNNVKLYKGVKVYKAKKY